MTILYIIISVVFLAFLWLVFSSIRLRLEFDEPIRLASISYAFVSFRADLKALQGKLRLFGIRVFRFDFKATKESSAKPKMKKEKTRDKKITRVTFEKEPSEEKPEKKTKKSKKKKFRFTLDYLDLVSVKNLLRIKRFIGKITFEVLDIEIKGGFEDPYRTGQAVASYWAARGIIPKVMNHVRYYPDFDIEKFEFRGKAVVSLRVIHILVLVFSLLTEFLKIKVRQIIKNNKKGLAYG